MTESVVVPAVSVPSAYTCLQSLSKRDVRTIVVSERESPEIACSRYCDESIHVPSPAANERKYRDALLSLAERKSVRTIIPLRDEDIFILSKYRESFAEHVGTPWPEFEKLRCVHDRIELFEIAEKVGVPTPETKLLTDCDDWSRKWIVKARYALLADAYLGGTVKASVNARENPSTTRSRSGIASPPSTEYLTPGIEPDVDSICAKNEHVPLIQEFMDDTDEYAFFAIYDRGEPLATFQHRQIRGFNYSGGPSAFRKSVNIPELEREGRKLLDYLDWHGPAMVEFKRDRHTDEFQLMEINPRFWSSLPFTVQAGADFPLYYWLLATGRQQYVEPGYQVGTGGHLGMGEIFYLYSILYDDVPLVERPPFGAALTSVLMSMVKYPHFDYLDVTDPCPALKYVYNNAKSLFE